MYHIIYHNHIYIYLPYYHIIYPYYNNIYTCIFTLSSSIFTNTIWVPSACHDGTQVPSTVVAVGQSGGFLREAAKARRSGKSPEKTEGFVARKKGSEMIIHYYHIITMIYH